MANFTRGFLHPPPPHPLSLTMGKKVGRGWLGGGGEKEDAERQRERERHLLSYSNDLFDKMARARTFSFNNHFHICQLIIQFFFFLPSKIRIRTGLIYSSAVQWMDALNIFNCLSLDIFIFALCASHWRAVLFLHCINFVIDQFTARSDLDSSVLSISSVESVFHVEAPPSLSVDDKSKKSTWN